MPSVRSFTDDASWRLGTVVSPDRSGSAPNGAYSRHPCTFTLDKIWAVAHTGILGPQIAASHTRTTGRGSLLTAYGDDPAVAEAPLDDPTIARAEPASQSGLVHLGPVGASSIGCGGWPRTSTSMCCAESYVEGSEALGSRRSGLEEAG